MKQIAYVLIGLLFGFIMAGAIFLVTHLKEGTAIVLEPSPTKVQIEVQVIGGVVHPGVYSFPEGSRVQDAITAAGGLLAGTEPNSINLVAKLVDGQQLEIPNGTNTTSSSTTTAPFSVISTPGGASSNLVNINTATLEELEALPYIGPTTAQNIIDYRTAHGPFPNIQELIQVRGIGATTLDLIQNLITTQ